MNQKNIFIGIDFETGGLYPEQNDAIIQVSVGAYKLCKSIQNKLYFIEIDTYNDYVYPVDKWNYNKEALDIHGKDKNFLTLHGKDKDEVWNNIISFYKKYNGNNSFFWGYNTIAHNAEFDMRFLKFMENECNVEKNKYFKCTNKVICTMHIFNLLRILNIHSNNNSKLDDMVNVFNIDIERNNSHDSMEDVRIMMSCFSEMLNLFPNSNIVIENSKVIEIQKKEDIRWHPTDEEWKEYNKRMF